MADRLYLSYMLNGFSGMNMLRHYEKLLRLFPYSRLMLGASVFKIIPIAYSEPARIEESYAMPEGIEPMLATAKEFLNSDSCYRLETWWDLWQYEAGEWKLTPARAALVCYGPEFQDAEGNLEIEFGIENLFLPQAGLPNNINMAQSNIKSLLKLVHDADDALSVKQRRLWSEGGENFAERVQLALREAG